MAELQTATKEQRILVRLLVANLGLKKPEGDQLTLRVALCKKFYLELNQLEPTHLLRAYEALCEVDFPDDDTKALRDLLARQHGRLLKLRSVRSVVIERPAKPVCPHN